MPVLDRATVAATLLVKVKTKLGKAVPEYAKKIANWDPHTIAEGQRAQAELEKLLTQMRRSQRHKLFEEMPKLALWYELYTTCDRDTTCAELTNHLDRPASKVREEYAAKRAGVPA